MVMQPRFSKFSNQKFADISSKIEASITVRPIFFNLNCTFIMGASILPEIS